ncbi:Hypothetical predicted protein [Olea europaea subsp. europaea]|uniref:Uncharacterized protein n=1 Tax=Olea europaea subsp. europaea TaxID=158383 RepID=A0A8S0RJ05_OLEEU|nr:Hypothetical predicted protein [Olea europaea subsp. europaea]
MESESASKSNQLINTKPEDNREDGKPLLEENNPKLSSRSSSSSSSLELCNGIPDNSSSKSQHEGALSSESESLSSPDVYQTPQWSMMSASPRAGSTLLLSQELSRQNQDWNAFSTMKSPPVQNMGRPTDYDPNRIPASVFITKRTGNMEWSVASNESLFSIHMGNNSFTRGYAMFGKSGEFPRLEEWNSSPSNLHYVPETKSGELNSSASSLPPLIEVPADIENSVKLGETSRVEKEDCGLCPKVAPTETVEDQAKEKPAMTEEIHLPPSVSNVSDGKISTHSPLSPSCPSDDSGNSNISFAFPVLVKDGVKTESLKTVPKEPVKPQLDSKPSNATPKASEMRWFSCFFCWPLRH